MENYLIIHGTFGHSQENWFPWLENLLNTHGKEVYNLTFPTPINQNFENWSKVLNQYKNKIGKNTTFICHSIGSVFIAKYLLLNKISVNKCIFVAGCNNYYSIQEFDELNKTFFIDNLNNFNNYCPNTICFYSNTDPYITFDALKSFAKEVNATKEILINNAGHFNEKSEYTKFEELIKEI